MNFSVSLDGTMVSISLEVDKEINLYWMECVIIFSMQYMFLSQQ